MMDAGYLLFARQTNKKTPTSTVSSESTYSLYTESSVSTKTSSLATIKTQPSTVSVLSPSHFRKGMTEVQVIEESRFIDDVCEVFTLGDDTAFIALTEREYQFRESIVEEIYVTERAYVGHLKQIVNSYLVPLRNAVQQQAIKGGGFLSGKAICTEHEISVIFGNVERLLELHSILLTELDTRFQIWGPAQILSDILSSHHPFLRVYRHYLDNYTNGIAMLEKLGQSGAFNKFMEGLNQRPGLNGHTLYTLLQIPIHRLSRYPNQIQKLFSSTFALHPDYDGLKRCCYEVQHIYTSDLSTKMGDCLNLIFLFDIEHQVQNLQFNVITPTRRLVKRGTLWKVDPGNMGGMEQRAYFLFNGSVMYAKQRDQKNQLGPATISSDATFDAVPMPTFTFKAIVELSNATVRECDHPKYPYCFELTAISANYQEVLAGSAKEVVVLRCLTSEDRDAWVRAFANVIAALKRAASATRALPPPTSAPMTRTPTTTSFSSDDSGKTAKTNKTAKSVKAPTAKEKMPVYSGLTPLAGTIHLAQSSRDSKVGSSGMLEAITDRETALLRVIILGLIATVAFASRLFSIVRFESVIHEFDPWFNYRTTQYLVKNGFYDFWNWFDEKSWYPLGRVVGGTLYPGLMVTSAVIHNILHFLHFPVDIRNICVLIAPFFSGLTAFATYLLTTEMKDASAGLLAAAFIGIAPGYVSRSVAGSYDYEGIAIFILMFVFYLWIKALKLGSATWAAATAFFYFYMVSSWGGYVFIINLIPLHAFALMLMGRFSSRLYVAYSTFYILGTLMSMQIPFVGFQPTKTSEHMAALGIFGLCQIMAFVELVRSHVAAKQFQVLFRTFLVAFFVLAFVALVGLTMTGYIAPWTGRYYSLWDTGYAKIHIPIIASVSEHQPTAWPSYYFDLEMLIFLFPAGIYLCFKQLRDEHVFIIIYGLTASYFSGVMVRLMLTLTPVVCVAAGIALSTLFDTYLDMSVPSDTQDHTNVNVNGEQMKATNSALTAKASSAKKEAKKGTSTSKKVKDYFGIFHFDTRAIVLGNMVVFLVIFVWHCTWVTSNAYSSPSIVLASRNADGSQFIIDDFREAYYWLRQNTKEDAKVMSWWDYGYQLAGMADRVTLVDNNTWNNTHIATVGKAMASNEETSYQIMKKHDVDYVLVIFGGLLGYSGDDINKFLWMVRIAEGIWPDEVKESNFFTSNGEYRVDDMATPTMRNSLMYKMSYHRFAELFGGQPPVDRVRQSRLPVEGPKLSVLEEAFTSQNWIVRIYKVKDYDNLGRRLDQASDFENGIFGKKRRGRASRRSS